MRVKVLLIIMLFVVPLCAEPLNRITDPVQSRQIDENFVDIDLNKQNALFSILTTTPTLTDLRNGQVKLHSDSGVYHIYIRIGNDLIQFDGVKIN